MDSSALLKPNVTQELINVLMRSMLFAAYANIIEIRDDSVVVQGSICDNLTPFTTTVKLIYPTTKFVQMTFKPEVGDKVLVVGLQSYSDKMFSADKLIRDVPENNVQHYTILGCVAIPLNIENSEVPLRISDGDFKAGTKDVHGITINEGDDPVVRWSELKSVLQSLWTAYNGHKHTGATSVPDMLWMQGQQPTFTDLASEVLAVPKAATGA